jgi:hypothetical protein
MTTGGGERGRAAEATTGGQGAAQAGDADAANELRDFKTQARALPAERREEAFQSDEFRRLIAAAAVPAVVTQAACASHCFSHCGSHCYGHV